MSNAVLNVKTWCLLWSCWSNSTEGTEIVAMLQSKSHRRGTRQRVFRRDIYDAQNLACVFPEIALLPLSVLFPRTFGDFLKSHMRNMYQLILQLDSFVILLQRHYFILFLSEERKHVNSEELFQQLVRFVRY